MSKPPSVPIGLQQGVFTGWIEPDMVMKPGATAVKSKSPLVLVATPEPLVQDKTRLKAGTEHLLNLALEAAARLGVSFFYSG